MFPALGLHLFYKKRSNTYKDKNEGLWDGYPPKYNGVRFSDHVGVG